MAEVIADSTTDRRRSALRRYLVSALLARIADEGVRVCLVLLAVSATGNPAIGGAMIATLLVPHVAAAPVVGALIDRTKRPRATIAMLIGGFAAALFAVALLIGHVPLWIVFALLLAGGCCGPAITGGLTGQIPGLVGTGSVPRAFGFDSLFYNVASMTGPAIAGVVSTTVSPAVALIVLAVSAALGALCVATLPLPARRGRPAPAGLGLLSGAREIVRKPTLLVVTATSTLAQLGPGALPVVVVVLAGAWHEPAAGGLLLTVMAAGSFVGSVLCTWRPIRPDRAPLVMAFSMIGIGVCTALAALFSSMVVVAAFFGLSGAFIGPFGAALFLTRTQEADESVRTQVFTIGAGLKVTTSALGAALIGLATPLSGPAQLLLAAAGPLLAGVVAVAALSARRRRASDSGDVGSGVQESVVP
jgi:MFS family permease